jgi:hypothetical protein
VREKRMSEMKAMEPAPARRRVLSSDFYNDERGFGPHFEMFMMLIAMTAIIVAMMIPKFNEKHFTVSVDVEGAAMVSVPDIDIDTPAASLRVDDPRWRVWAAHDGSVVISWDYRGGGKYGILAAIVVYFIIAFFAFTEAAGYRSFFLVSMTVVQTALIFFVFYWYVFSPSTMVVRPGGAVVAEAIRGDRSAAAEDVIRAGVDGDKAFVVYKDGDEERTLAVRLASEEAATALATLMQGHIDYVAPAAEEVPPTEGTPTAEEEAPLAEETPSGEDGVDGN